MSLVQQAPTTIAKAATWLTDRYRSSPKNLPASARSSAALVYTDGGRQVARANARLFRNWADHSEWVRAAIDLRKDQVARAEWDIVPVDPEKPYSQALADRLREVIAGANPREKSYETAINMVLEDYLVLDAGCAELEFTLRGDVARWWPVDGATVRVSTIWDGEDPNEARYFWYPDHQKRAEWLDTEFMYMMGTESTFRVVGLSPLETLKMAIDSELGASSYNDRQMRQAAPDGMLDLGEGARPDQVEEFKSFWAAEVAGRGAMAILGGTRNAKWVPFRQSNRDAQFLEWQEYLVRKICAVFKISMSDLGFTKDVNRANGNVDQENTEDRGIRPLLGEVETWFTSGIVQHPSNGGPANNLKFGFTALNLKESQTQAKINKDALGGIPWKVIDEARRDDGRPPIGGTLGRSLIVMGPKGPVLLTEGEIPTAREALEAGPKQPTTPGGGQPPSSSSKAADPVPVLAGLAEVGAQE